MNRSMIAAVASAVVLSVVPAFAMEEQQQPQNMAQAAADFAALSGIEHEAQLNDSELAKIEGAANPVAGAGAAGLVNVVAAAAVGADHIRVIRDITVQGVQVQILGAGQRQ